MTPPSLSPRARSLCVSALPRLVSVDASTLADLERERDALKMQCEILGHVQPS